MPGDVIDQGATQAQPYTAGPAGRQVSDGDKKLSADLLKQVQCALDRPGIKESFKTFEKNRKLLRGLKLGTETEAGVVNKVRTNLHYANLASIRPQVYAKDPEYSVQPTKAVPDDQLDLYTKFCETSETLLSQLLIKDAKLKKRAKRLLTSAYTTSVGWWKVMWQETPKTDPIIANRMRDTQDNLERLQQLRSQMDDPALNQDQELQIAELQQQLAGLEGQSEVSVARGPVIDFCLSEDIIVLDDSVRELCDYERADAIAHRVWFTCDKYERTFGYRPTKAKRYSEKAGGAMSVNQPSSTPSASGELLCVYEIWDQSSNRVLTVCEGEEGFCKPPYTPDWTGERWYPFFALIWNEIDGTFYPQSDIELTEKLVNEYNENRDDLVRDRRDSLPFTVVRKGGALTPDDVSNIRNRHGNDIITVEGVGNQPLQNDIQGIQLGKIDPQNYNTQPARSDIEQIVGGGDASRGSVLEAKTATEAEILSQGLRGRSAERTDTMEDLLSEVGVFVLQMCLRRLSEAEVKSIAGQDAVWPQMDVEQIFKLVTVNVRGGSTGKPDRLQEQDRWTKLQPVIKDTVMTVADLYGKGQVKLGQALVAILRETLRRFDERIDIDQYLPEAPKDGQQDPAMTEQENQMLKQKVQELTQSLQQAESDKEKALISAYASIATSPTPAQALIVFDTAMRQGDPSQLPPDQVQQQQPPQSGIPQPQPM